MEPGEALSIASQLAMALAGFAGVVVAFRSGALHEWAPIDKLRLRLLLGNSVVPFGISTTKGSRAIGLGGLSAAGTSRLLFFGMGSFGIAVGLLQIYNIVVLNAFWAFFATIVVHLVAGFLQFVRLILLPLHPTT
jgi:hypothetical protein